MGNGTYSGKEVYNLSSSTVKARKNYWGGTPTSSDFYGSVDYSYYLQNPPQSVFMMPIASNDVTLLKGGGNGKDTQIKKQRIEELELIIAQEPESTDAVNALREIYHYIRGDKEDCLGERNSIFNYLNSIYLEHKDLDLGKIALQLMVNERMRAEDMKKAVQLAEDALDILKDNNRKEMMATLTLFYIQQDRLPDAEKLYSQFIKSYSEDAMLTEFLAESITEAPQNVLKNAQKGKVVAQLENKPEYYFLAQNYPNPFNPTTTFSYKLPRESQVTLIIFDLRGRQIERLVDEKKSTGIHKITWNAGNLPSGVYFCKMTVGNFIAIRKLLLLK